MTLVELVVTTAILGVVLTAVMSLLFTVQTAFTRQSNRSETNDQIRLAVEQLDREIRSGNLLYDPSTENDAANGIYPGMALRVYTQNNATTRAPGNRCVQWRILNGQLQTRSWSTEWRTDDIVEQWRIVATGIMNQTVSPQVAGFALDPDPSKGGRTLIITILDNTNTSSNTTLGNTVKIQESVTGRNTSYGFPSSVCSDIPPYDWQPE